MRYTREVLVKGVEQGTAPLPDFKSEERILRVIVQQEDTVYTTENLPHVTMLTINLPWYAAKDLRVGQKAHLTFEVQDADVEKEQRRMYNYPAPSETV